jgi:poly(3-hydroxybutyrate) depolymerase
MSTSYQFLKPFGMTALVSVGIFMLSGCSGSAGASPGFNAGPSTEPMGGQLSEQTAPQAGTSQQATGAGGTIAAGTRTSSNSTKVRDPSPTLSSGCGLTGKQAGDFHLSTTDGSGNNRDYEVMVPANYNAATAYPLTFVYHGLSGNQAISKGYGIQDAPNAAASGIFVFPLSLDPGGNVWADTCSGKDVRFFDNMLTALQSNYCIDTKRIFVAGFSWGCDHATALVACRGDKIRGASMASCTGDFRKATDYKTYTNLPTPVTVNTAFRFTHDAAGDQYYSLQAFQSTIALYRSFNNCASTSSPVAPSPCVAYDTCNNPVIECSYPNLGHVIPTGWGTASWDFFASL